MARSAKPRKAYTAAEREGFAAKAAGKRQKCDALISGGLDALTDPAAWAGFLAMSAGSNIARYSLRNQVLVYSQAPEARDVCGYREWQARGRQVRKGQEGILIFAPYTRKMTTDTETGKARPAEKGEDGEKKITAMSVASVFEHSQTDAIEGKEEKPLAGWKPRTLDEIREAIAEVAGDHAEDILAAMQEAIDGPEEDEEADEDEDLEADDEAA